MTDLIWENVKKFRYPVIIIHGKEDTLTLPEPATDFYKKCSSQDKTIEIFEEGRHEMQWDAEREKVAAIHEIF